MAQRWVCLDVGETLVDETRVCAAWATVLGLTPFTVMAAYGAVIALGQDHRAAFDLLGRPDWKSLATDFDTVYGSLTSTDLYPDALASLPALRGAGYRVAIVANQPARRSTELRALGFHPDVLAMSDELRVHKPDPAFFKRALELMGADAGEVAYIGDRLDNDVGPAAVAGLRTVWIRRGPWALLAPGEAPAETLVIDSLTELVARVGGCWPEQ